jgi:hypothetical protein
MSEIDRELLLPGDVAELARRTPDAVRLAIRTGRLHATRTASGVRLIRRADAEAYARAAAGRDAARRRGAEAGA